MAEHQPEQLDFKHQHQTPDRPPTPTERRRMLVNATAAFDQKFPREPGDASTAEEAVDNAIAKGIVHLDYRVQEAVTAAEVAAFEEQDQKFTIPRQAQIECRALVDGGVEIWQEGQHGTDEDATIHVAAVNAVMLARQLLAAAGFAPIGIYTRIKGGNIDIDDGDLPANVYSDN